MRWPIAILLVLALVPPFSGTDPVLPLRADLRMEAAPYVPEGGWPRRIGALQPVGALRLTASDPSFGGFSALTVQGGAALMLSDGGNYVRFAIAGGRLRTLAAGALPAGPGTGWAREDRDTESLVYDAAVDHAWVGFENGNAIWRYDARLRQAQAQRAPAAMRGWPVNGGAEAMARYGDRFIVIAEQARVRPGIRQGVIFEGDPALPGTRSAKFGFVPPPHYAPSDATMLPGGDLLVLVRRWERVHFSAKLVRVPRRELRAGATVRGQVIATLAPPLLRENAEGLAITRERGATMVWIVTDNDGWWTRPTLLLKFRLR